MVLVIYGAAISVYPTWLSKYQNSIIPIYAFFQIFEAVILICTGGYLADHIYGLPLSFKRYSGNDAIPYSSIMYYGGVAQAAYGSFLVSLSITMMVVTSVATYCEGRQKRVNKPRKEVVRVARISLVELPNV